MDQYLKIFSCCRIVKGAERASVYDTQRKQLYFLPLFLCELIDPENDAIHIEAAKKRFPDERSVNIIGEYIEYLLAQEIGFLCSEKDLALFPKMDTSFSFPAHITNIIIDSTVPEITFMNSAFLEQLEKLCCNYMQFRFFKPVRSGEIQVLLDIINPTQIKAIELVLSCEELWQEEVATRFLSHNRKVRNLTVTGAPVDKVLQHENYLDGSIIYTKGKIESHLHCGIVQLDQFSLNLTHYTESLHHNTCLNRKVAIDVHGNIKNCPSMKESFGNIRDTTLEEAINKPGFRKYWNITKDQITKCKDCEFRHICTDCRAYTDDPEDSYAAPLKCGYNPYTCEWEEWSTHPLKQQAIERYGMRTIL